MNLYILSCSAGGEAAPSDFFFIYSLLGAQKGDLLRKAIEISAIAVRRRSSYPRLHGFSMI